MECRGTRNREKWIDQRLSIARLGQVFRIDGAACAPVLPAGVDHRFRRWRRLDGRKRQRRRQRRHFGWILLRRLSHPAAVRPAGGDPLVTSIAKLETDRKSVVEGKRVDLGGRR